VDLDLAVLLADCNARRDLPVRVAAGSNQESGVRLSQRFEGQHSTVVAGASQARCKLADVRADVKRQIHAVMREHGGQSTAFGRLGPTTSDVEPAAVCRAANPSFDEVATHDDLFGLATMRR
jgi:hypothetical protein